MRASDAGIQGDAEAIGAEAQTQFDILDAAWVVAKPVTLLEDRSPDGAKAGPESLSLEASVLMREMVKKIAVLADEIRRSWF